MARTTDTATVWWLCSGNICRSPLLDHLARQRLAAEPALSPLLVSRSAGVAPWCGGKPVHRHMVAAAAAHGIALPPTLSQRWDAQHPTALDLVVPLDEAVSRATAAGLPPDVPLLPLHRLDVPFTELADPYGRGPAAFDTAVGQAQRLADAFLRLLTSPRERRRAPLTEALTRFLDHLDTATTATRPDPQRTSG